MKQIQILLIFAAFIGTSLAQNYFPLENSNKFEYRSEYYQSYPGGSESGVRWYKVEVVDDSVINGKTFYRLDGADVFFWPGFGYNNDQLFYYDSLDNKLFVKIAGDDSVRLGVDFNMEADSTFISYLFGSARELTTRGTVYDTLFNNVIKTFRLEYYSDYHRRYLTFGENFGVIFYHLNAYDAGWGSSFADDTLCSAIIDTNVYNYLNIQITDISPLIDRPQNAFPFVLHGSYTASVPYLVDSFYIKMEVIRNEQVIINQHLDFDHGEINIPLQPSMLQAGDIIRIKATLTDKSIFRNIVHFPDSDWAEFAVLPPVGIINSNEENLTYNLSQNYPNPFNPATVISYQLPEKGFVSLKVFNLLGEEMDVLVNEFKPAGKYEINFDGSALSSGVYIYRLTQALIPV